MPGIVAVLDLKTVVWFLSTAPCIWQSLVLWNGFRMLHSLVRQWIHVWRQSTRLFGRISLSSRGGFWEMTSCLSPYSALSLVRQQIHALRQSTELFEEAHIF